MVGSGRPTTGRLVAQQWPSAPSWGPCQSHTPAGAPTPEPHHDFFYDDLNKAPEVGGQRLLTALMYLTTPEEGGETVFPQSPTQTPREGLSACVKKGLAHQPRKGDLLIFYSLHPDGTEDKASMHQSCPVLKGVSGRASTMGSNGREGCGPSAAGSLPWAAP